MRVLAALLLAGGLLALVVAFRSSASPPRQTAPPPRVEPTVRQESAPEARASALPEGIDLDALRSSLPDNRYWKSGAPTDDPAVLEARAENARAENELYGKVLSGTGADDEIDAYYAERRLLLEDYAALARAVLLEPGLSERDRGLFELALRMDEDRLAALPGELDAARARKTLQDQRRAAWNVSRSPAPPQ